MSLVDNFDSYSDGELSGQGTWTVNKAACVVGAAYKQGASGKGVLGYHASESWSAYATFDGQTHGIQRFWIKSDQTNKETEISFRDGTTKIFGFLNLFNSTISLWSLDNQIILVEVPSTGTWYEIDVEWDQSRGVGNGQLRGRVNEGTWSDWVEINAAFTSISRVYIYGAIAAYLYFDNFSDENVSSGPANLKTYNTNAKSNIKTINTNAIANVKSLDTNV